MAKGFCTPPDIKPLLKAISVPVASFTVSGNGYKNWTAPISNIPSGYTPIGVIGWSSTAGAIYYVTMALNNTNDGVALSAINTKSNDITDGSLHIRVLCAKADYFE